jgi:hypothetical protein
VLIRSDCRSCTRNRELRSLLYQKSRERVIILVGRETVSDAFHYK